MKHLTHKNNFFYLFSSLLVFLFTAALIAQFPSDWGEDILSMVALAMILISIKSLKIEKSWRWAALVLGFLFFAIIVFVKYFEHHLLVYTVLALLFIYFTAAFLLAVKHVLFEGDIDENKIIGSLSLYLLIGLIWSVIYLFLLIADPSSFSGVEITNWQESFSRVAYYSFVTLTTLGYGDILPTNHIAEFFVYLEAVFGVFYMAIIVSSLIALRLDAIQQKRKGR
ncbi:potassium channel family protein [Sulfurovum riftiae]|uniref:Potassium channel domain-containing protein n=1 Tax=Sulfurovum riftiae TaxID=1630136 RepID=A0A151CJG7_9BACT|nr:potassium channel family protein [Sulfurovum riftiae]KYJ87680.1 hypothetical protein AS592_11345 [Sulfurovum riftiae]